VQEEETMTVKRATFDIESTKQAAFYEEEAERPGSDRPMSALIVEVQDFEEALEIVDTLNRSRAQKKRERKPADQVPSPAPVTEKTAPPPRGAGDGSGQEVTPPKEAAAKARALGNKLSEVTG
jgi:hypothetical protein